MTAKRPHIGVRRRALIRLAGALLARQGGRGNTLSLPLDQQATVRNLLEYQTVLNDADVVLAGTIPAN